MFAKFDNTGRSVEITNYVDPDRVDEYVPVPDGISGPVLFLDDGVVREATPEELAVMDARAAVEVMASEARVRRNRLLMASDVLVLADRWASYTDEQRSEIGAYRAALRDIPEQESFPDDIVWPAEPTI